MLPTGSPLSPISPKRTSTRAHTASHPPQHPPDGLLGRHLHPRRHGAAVARDRPRRHIQGWWHRAVQPVRARRLGDGARVHRRHRPPPRLRPRRRLPARARRVGRARLRRRPGRRGGVRAPVRAGARLGRRALRGRLRQPPHPADHAGGRGDERGGQRRRRPPRRPRVARVLLQPVRHRHRRCRPPPRRPRPARSRHSPPRPLLLRRAQRYVRGRLLEQLRARRLARRRRRNLVEGRRDAARLAVRHRRHAARPEDGRRRPHLRLFLPLPLPRRHHSGGRCVDPRRMRRRPPRRRRGERGRLSRAQRCARNSGAARRNFRATSRATLAQFLRARFSLTLAPPHPQASPSTPTMFSTWPTRATTASDA